MKILLLTPILLLSCGPLPSEQPYPPLPTPPTTPENILPDTSPPPQIPTPVLATAPPPTPTSTTPAKPPALTRKIITNILFEGVSFDSRTHRLQVIDQPAGPGTLHQDAASLCRQTGALAAINAGFFTPEGKPLGLVIANNKNSGTWNTTSSLGSGIWLENPQQKPSITRRTPTPPHAKNLIQAGPLLIENHQPISGLNTSKPAIRTLILTDGKTNWWIGRTSTSSLASLANALNTSSPANFPVKTALNLDGGRSADLHITNNIPGGPITRRSPINRSVRNFLILTTKTPPR